MIARRVGSLFVAGQQLVGQIEALIAERVGLDVGDLALGSEVGQHGVDVDPGHVECGVLQEEREREAIAPAQPS